MLITSEPLKAKSPEEVRNQLKSDLKQLLGDGYVSREFLTDSKWFDDALRSALAEVILWTAEDSKKFSWGPYDVHDYLKKLAEKICL